MKKQLLITKEIFELNKDNIKVMELFASGQLEVGKYYANGFNNQAISSDSESNPTKCCGENCPANPVGAHYECVLCNCILVNDPS